MLISPVSPSLSLQDSCLSYRCPWTRTCFWPLAFLPAFTAGHFLLHPLTLRGAASEVTDWTPICLRDSYPEVLFPGFGPLVTWAWWPLYSGSSPPFSSGYGTILTSLLLSVLSSLFCFLPWPLLFPQMQDTLHKLCLHTHPPWPQQSLLHRQHPHGYL